MKFNLEVITKMSALVIVSAFILLIFAILGPREFGSGFLAAYGSIMSAMVAAAGIPILLQNIKKQDESIEQVKQQQLSDSMEKEFKYMCDSVDLTLGDLFDSGERNLSGRSLLINKTNRFAEDSDRDDILKYTFIKQLGTLEMYSLVNSLIVLSGWIASKEEYYVYETFFRIRYGSILSALARLLPYNYNDMTLDDKQGLWDSDDLLFHFYYGVKVLLKNEYEIFLNNNARVRVPSPYESDYEEDF